jgi:arginyl-tRNA synthetase
VRLRLSEDWIEGRGEALEAGEGAAAGAGDLAAGQSYAVYFWGANTTKALHIGHLRNLAVGNAIGASLAQAGGLVEHRSLICDVGRSMGEAMAGVVGRGGEEPQLDNGDKSDHFVGHCYADYVKAGRTGIDRDADDGAEDSVARESSMYNDKADELMMRVLGGDQPALELWSKTRAWVIAGQRKTLARLGIGFDKVIFESDFLPEVAELTNLGLSEGTLTRRYGDDMVMYETEREELEEMPLVRADGLPTQHMRALAYWAAAPELDGVTSLQVCGNEWVAHVTCRRQLIDALGVSNGNGSGSARGGGPPTHDIFHGMVARENRSISSSKGGALLVDELAEWLEGEIATRPECAEVRASHPAPDRIPAQVALAYFLLQPTTKKVDFDPERLLVAEKESLGWDLARAQAHRGGAPLRGERPAEDLDYRFAVVQSEVYRRHLGSAVERFDVVPLARYLSHFARWYREQERSPRVERAAQAVLEDGIRGLGLEGV